MKKLIYNARIFNTFSKTYFDGDVLIENGIISDITHGESPYGKESIEKVDADGKRLYPGLVDVHTHGRAGFDFVNATVDEICIASKSYLDTGVTTVMPTLASATQKEFVEAIERIETVKKLENEEKYLGRLAHFGGTHLEGRYLNPNKRGAHSLDLLVPLDGDELAETLSHITGARHVSAALELDNDGSFLKKALEMGATVSLGHTEATYAQTVDCVSRGVTALTHLYNTMPQMHHREGGVICAGLLLENVYCELICDGFHIAPEMVKLASVLKKDHLVLITDSMAAAGCKDGNYSIAGLSVIVKDGKARTVEGAIAGSTVSLWEAVKNYARFANVTFEDAICAATASPACEVGLFGEIGSITVGKRADILLVDESLNITDVFCGGYRAK